MSSCVEACQGSPSSCALEGKTSSWIFRRARSPQGVKEIPMAHDDLCWMNATELASAIRSKKISPVEVTKAVLARIESVNPRINAFCTVVGDRALAEARTAESAVMKGGSPGPLHGVPISFK